jgi:hypothetical protein
VAGFFYTGEVEFFVRPRPGRGLAGAAGAALASAAGTDWKYLGAAVTFPTVEEQVLHRELKCDRSGDAPWQEVSAGEVHVVTTVMSRLNFSTLRLLRGVPDPAAYAPKIGKLVRNSKDFELFVRYALPNDVTVRVPPPAGAAKGRLYYSASLEMSRLQHPSRVQEVGLIFKCVPLWDNKNRKWLFWSEADADFPTTLTVE